MICGMVLQRLLARVFDFGYQGFVDEIVVVILKFGVLNFLNSCRAKTFSRLQKLLSSEKVNSSAEKVFVAISTGIGVNYLGRTGCR